MCVHHIVHIVDCFCQLMTAGRGKLPWEGEGFRRRGAVQYKGVVERRGRASR